MRPVTVTTRRTWGIQGEPGWDCGIAGLAIARCHSRTGEMELDYPWAIIHVRSGLQIVCFEDPELAVKACHELGATGVDWERPTPELAVDKDAQAKVLAVKDALGGHIFGQAHTWARVDLPEAAA